MGSRGGLGSSGTINGAVGLKQLIFFFLNSEMDLGLCFSVMYVTTATSQQGVS